MLSGLQVAVEDINASGGVLGHPVALDYQSDDSTPTKAPLALQSIFSGGKKIIYMLPNVLPNITATVLQYTEKDGIASFDAGSGPNLFDVGTHPYNFSIYPANTLQVPAYVAAFSKLTGGAGSGVKLGVINDTEAADQTLAGLIMAATKQAGGSVVDQEQIDPTATDVSVQVKKLQQAGANVVLIQASGNIPFEVAQAVQSLNWTTVKMVASPATLNATTMSATASRLRWYSTKASIPPGMLIKSASSSPTKESSMVAGSATIIRWETGWRKLSDVPRLPLMAAHSQIRNCWGIGLSKPSCCLSAAASAGVADAGNSMPSGSTGRIRSTKNTTSESNSNVGTASNTRRTTMAEMTWNIASDPLPARDRSDHRYFISAGRM